MATLEAHDYNASSGSALPTTKFLDSAGTKHKSCAEGQVIFCYSEAFRLLIHTHLQKGSETSKCEVQTQVFSLLFLCPVGDSTSVFNESPLLKNIVATAMYETVISGFRGPEERKSSCC